MNFVSVLLLLMRMAPGNSFTSFPQACNKQCYKGSFWIGGQISPWLPRNHLSMGNTERDGTRRYIDAKAAPTHTSVNNLDLGERKRMKQKGKLENSVLESIFVFSVLPFLPFSL